MQAINKYRFFTFIAVLVWSTASISPLQGCRCSGPADFCSSLGSDLDSDHSVFVIATIDLIGTTRMRARLIKRLFGDPIFTEFWIEGGDEGDCITGTWRFTSGQVYLFHLGIHDRKYYKISLDERSTEINVRGFENSDRMQWALVDLHGRIAAQSIFSHGPSELQIPLPDLPAGSCFFRISDGILCKTQLVVFR